MMLHRISHPFTAVVGLLLVAACADAAADYETTSVADGVYRFRWQQHNGLFVVTPAGVVAVDPISVDAASGYADEIERVAPGQPLLAVVYSHHHADHASGADVLRDRLGRDAPIIAHVNAVDDIDLLAAPELPAPTVTFSDRLTLHHGGTELQLHYLGNSHSDNMLVVLLPATGVAFAVDFVAHDRVGYQELPGYVFPDFFDTVDRLAELDFATIVFGHGPNGDKASVERQAAYYAALRDAVSAAVEAGMTEDEAAESVHLDDYAHFSAYEEWFSGNVRGMYRWLADR
jgi:glyoxylase-like metal-dependent hydrolase (beta-lactamase superfamily II)